MIQLIFYYGQEIVLARIKGTSVYLASQTNGAVESPIDGLKLDKAGIIREFPDLKDRTDWREEAISRFKKHCTELGSEEKVAEYVISDLKKYGYTPKLKQIAGFRPTKIN